MNRGGTMADRTVLEAQSRTVLGKKVKNLRKLGRIPATVYGHKLEAQTIELDARHFRAMYSAAGDAQLFDLVIDKKRAHPVLVQRIQLDPKRNTVLHVEFHQANLREKLIAHVPIHLVGESPVTRLGMMVLSELDSLEVECLPTNIPNSIEIDISQLTEAGSSIHVRDLDVDTSTVTVRSDPDELLVHVAAARGSEEQLEETAAEAPAEQPVEAE
jgi:large subunit ribosomal protein L25